jgi:hypothetical protein
LTNIEASLRAADGDHDALSESRAFKGVGVGVRAPIRRPVGGVETRGNSLLRAPVRAIGRALAGVQPARSGGRVVERRAVSAWALPRSRGSPSECPLRAALRAPPGGGPPGAAGPGTGVSDSCACRFQDGSTPRFLPVIRILGPLPVRANLVRTGEDALLRPKLVLWFVAIGVGVRTSRTLDSVRAAALRSRRSPPRARCARP